ncbi:hypothetical protein DE146DRAFT_731913 [Phaeosphaeria sp. MPI-PUGE-AT-0046c]|nr:hypothetical protein DE146DRAFT_731913 [Phaeosphaeria sp. MPI-PUGE-AT-0046c]
MSTSTPLRLGWIGLGSMGLAMALNMQKHLKEQDLPALQYWNRTIARGEPLQDLGGVPGQTPDEIVQNCDVIFISLSDDSAVQSLISSIPQNMLSGKTIVDTTTISPSTSSSITSLLSSHSATYVAAPVFGSTPVAQAGQILIALAGPPPAISRIKPLLQNVLARGIIEVGAEPKQAILLKTSSNFITAGLMMLLSEAHTLAEISGLPSSTLHDLVAQNFGAYAAGVSERLVSGAYCPARGEAPRSGLELGIKDVGHGVQLAREGGMQLRVGEMYLGAAGEAKAWGDKEGRRMDSSAVYGVVRERAGLGFERERGEGKDKEE